jgi:DNA-binding transcriptional MerR regulator
MASGTSASDHGTSTAVGEKLFYKIGEVSRLTGLPSYVLRFWESELGFLHPQKTRGRQRKYTPKDIEMLLQVKRMRYEQGFTLEGLKRRWHTRAGIQERRPSRDTVEVVRRVKHEVHEMLKVLSDST